MSFQTGGNLDDLLQDLEMISKDIDELQVKNKARSDTSLDQNKKPFRSEVSLVLDYPGDNLTIAPISSASAGGLHGAGGICGSLHEIETQLTIHPVPSDDRSLPSPPILKETHASTSFDQVLTAASSSHHMNNGAVGGSVGNGIELQVLTKSHTFETTDRKLSASESTLMARAKSKRVSLSLSGKKPKLKKPHEPPLPPIVVRRMAEPSPRPRRMSLDLDIDFKSHLPHTTQKVDTTTSSSHHQSASESRRHSYDSNKSHVSHHHKKRSRSDSITSRNTYSEQTSQRRLSITSYQAKNKIPWCGCWGLC